MVNLLSYKHEDDKKSNNQDFNEVQDFRFFDIKSANVLIVGATGTGKTTFLRTLKDPKYTAVAEMKSQTTEASLDQLLFFFNNEYYMLQVIDTPGFGDNTGKTDFELEELILKFVKKGIVKLDLVLITIKFGHRLEKGQIETLMKVLRFLGKDMKNNAAILYTHAEDIEDKDKRIWHKKVKKSSMKNIAKYCKKGPFFTGMIKMKDEMTNQLYIKQARKNQLPIISCAINSEPIPLSGEENENIANQFKVYESAAKDSLTVKKLLPALKSVLDEFVKLKVEFTKYKDDKKACEILEKYKNINEGEISKQLVEWGKLKNSVNEYIGKGSKMRECATELTTQYNAISVAKSEIRERIDQLDLFSGDEDEDSDSSLSLEEQ